MLRHGMTVKKTRTLSRSKGLTKSRPYKASDHLKANKGWRNGFRIGQKVRANGKEYFPGWYRAEIIGFAPQDKFKVRYEGGALQTLASDDIQALPRSDAFNSITKRNYKIDQFFKLIGNVIGRDPMDCLCSPHGFFLRADCDQCKRSIFTVLCKKCEPQGKNAPTCKDARCGSQSNLLEELGVDRCWMNGLLNMQIRKLLPNDLEIFCDRVDQIREALYTDWSRRRKDLDAEWSKSKKEPKDEKCWTKRNEKLIDRKAQIEMLVCTL